MRFLLVALLFMCVACGRGEAPQLLAADRSVASPQIAPFPIALPFDEMGRPEQGQKLRFDVAPGVHVVATRTDLQPYGAGNFTWTGATASNGIVVITRYKGAIVGAIFERHRWYRIVRRGTRLGVIPVKRHPRPKPGMPYRHLKHPPALPYNGPIEVVVAYTPASRKACDPIEAQIVNGVGLANAILANSGLESTSFHIAYGYETSYVEHRHDMKTIVDDFAGRHDPEMPEIHDLRDSHHGDVAVLVVSADIGADYGISDATTADSDHAFSVVDCSTLSYSDTLAHEFGHLFGLNDDDDPPTPETYPYGYGSWKDDGTTDENWHTTMSGGGHCKQDCSTSIPYFANPAKSYEGTPTGSAGRSEDTRVILETRGAVSQFKSGHSPTEWAPPTQ